MNKSVIIDQVATKVAEMEELLEELLKSDVSENTKRTQKFQRQTAIHTLKVLMAIAKSEGDDVKFTMDEDKWYKSMVTLTAIRKAGITIELHDGDKLMDILQKTNKPFDYIKKQCEKQGYKIVLDHIEKQ